MNWDQFWLALVIATPFAVWLKPPWYGHFGIALVASILAGLAGLVK